VLDRKTAKIAAVHTYSGFSGKRMSLRRFTVTISLAVTTFLSSIWAYADGPLVMISTTKGDLVIELNDERAPQSVSNFLQYVDDGFYDDTVFHRVIEGFMIQGGGFTQNYQRKKTRSPVSNEAYNGLRNQKYTIAMARTTAPHSATSQFFINSVNNRNLDHTNTTQRGWGYTVFGKVVKGEEVVDSISRVRTGAGGPFGRDVPAEAVVITSAKRIADLLSGAAAVTEADETAANPVSTEAGSDSAKSDLSPSNQTEANQSQPVEQNKQN